MYIPKQFEQPDIKQLHTLIRAHPLATLVTLSKNGLNANHIPLHLTESPAPYGTLRGHVARANPLLEDLNNNSEVLAIFHGAESYISPSWYATKRETGKVVPTWNYTVVHAYGVLCVIDDAASLRSQLEALTNQQESTFHEPWAVSDTPVEFTESLMKAIVGVEMVITRLLGQWKISQNQPEHNRIGVVEGLNTRGETDTSAMAALISELGR